MSRRGRRQRFAAFNFVVAFAFTVMADPVSSVAYALEAALRELGGDMRTLVLAMTLVVATIAVVSVAYHDLIGRFPGGGGGAEGLAAAFGEGWAFLPAGALVVDFTLTIAVSAAAAASALIAYAPALADARTLLAVALAVLVAAGAALGHRARIAFATATLLFLALAAMVVLRGAAAPPAAGHAPPVADASLGAAVLAMTLGMALATGVEAPSNAIAQLGRHDDETRRRIGRMTLWLMVSIVGALTLSLAVLAVVLDVGVPARDSTMLAEVARRATGGDAGFAAFQALSALLLLAAAASSYLAGSGLLKALAAHGEAGLLPRRFADTNRFDAPPWGLALLLAASVALIVLAGGRDQEIVHYYAVAVFAGFLGATVACARLALLDGRRALFAVCALGVLLVTFVLALNLRRGDPGLSLVASSAVSLALWRRWVRQGRPSGVASAMR